MNYVQFICTCIILTNSFYISASLQKADESEDDSWVIVEENKPKPITTISSQQIFETTNLLPQIHEELQTTNNANTTPPELPIDKTSAATDLTAASINSIHHADQKISTSCKDNQDSASTETESLESSSLDFNFWSCCKCLVFYQNSNKED